MIFGLLRKLFWLALFLAATFCFVVLFEHGPTNFVQNAQVEFKRFQQYWEWQPEQKKDRNGH